MSEHAVTSDHKTVVKYSSYFAAVINNEDFIHF